MQHILNPGQPQCQHGAYKQHHFPTNLKHLLSIIFPIRAFAYTQSLPRLSFFPTLLPRHIILFSCSSLLHAAVSKLANKSSTHKVQLCQRSLQHSRTIGICLPHNKSMRLFQGAHCACSNIRNMWAVLSANETSDFFFFFFF